MRLYFYPKQLLTLYVLLKNKAVDGSGFEPTIVWLPDQMFHHQVTSATTNSNDVLTVNISKEPMQYIYYINKPVPAQSVKSINKEWLCCSPI